MFPNKHSERRGVPHTVVCRMSGTNSTEASQAFQNVQRQGNCPENILRTFQKSKKVN